MVDKIFGGKKLDKNSSAGEKFFKNKVESGVMKYFIIKCKVLTGSFGMF